MGAKVLSTGQYTRTRITNHACENVRGRTNIRISVADIGVRPMSVATVEK